MGVFFFLVLCFFVLVHFQRIYLHAKRKEVEKIKLQKSKFARSRINSRCPPNNL